MPELPEVETIRRQLAPVVAGRELTALDILDPRWCLPLAPEAVRDAVEGRRVERLGRRGEDLVWGVGGGAVPLLHPRGTRTPPPRPPPAPPPPPARLLPPDGARARGAFGP